MGIIFSDFSGLFNNEKTIKLLKEGIWGIEKESHRVTPKGELALTDHPAEFGDKLDNPYITTDFSESQIELITPPLNSIEKTYDFLKKLNKEVEFELKNEFLWPLSMPPRLPGEDDIPIAKFNYSKEGLEKEIYRKGLSLRYGKKMQMISGIHYNFSFGENLLDYLYTKSGFIKGKQNFINEIYFRVARNYLRYRWLLIYLFGASPSIDQTYFPVIQKELNIIEKCCPQYCSIINDYKKYATSLRVSRFGYSGKIPANHLVLFNNLEEYSKK